MGGEFHEGGRQSILISTDISLSPEAIIRLNYYRFKKFSRYA